MGQCKLDAVIFDVDGTLWNSTESVAEAWNKAIEDFGGLSLRLDGEILKGLFGKTMDVICRQLFPALSDEERKRLDRLCFQYENQLLKTKPGIFYPGVYDTIKELSSHLPLFIVSNCQRGYIEVLLNAGGLAPFISGHLCFGETGLSKSGTLLRLMEQFDLKNVLYTGDTQGDLDACREAAVPFVYASYGFGHADNPDYIIHSIDELPGLIRSLL